MRKGSKSLRCYKCGKVVGWEIPTGKSHHGIKEVTQRLNKDGHIVDKYSSRYFYCTACKQKA